MGNLSGESREQNCKDKVTRFRFVMYRKIPKISPSKYKPPKSLRKKPSVKIAPPNISPPGGLYLGFALEYKVKQSINGKFPFHYKLTQLIL